MSTRATMIDPERQMLGEVEIVGQDRWEEIHRRAGAGASIRVIASAILDRILHHATTISIRGDSYRLKDKLKSGVVKPTTAAT